MKLTVNQVWPYLEFTMDTDFFERHVLDIENALRDCIRALTEEPEHFDEFYEVRYKKAYEQKRFAGKPQLKQEGNVAAVILHSVWRACHRAMQHAVTAGQPPSHPQSRLLPSSPAPGSNPVPESSDTR